MAIKVDYAVQESVTNMRRNLFMSFAAVLVVAVSLFLFGGVFLLRNAISRAADIFTAQVRVTVFMTDDIAPQDRDVLHEDLLGMPEVSTVIYEDKTAAFERFKRLFVDQSALIENTTPDALPESFRVRLRDPEKFEVIRDRLDGRPGVDVIRDERETVRQLFAATTSLRRAGLFMAIVVGAAATVLIATTIRMAIYSRRKEIGIMKLVGATNWFIRIPFMTEGIAQGVLGAIVALLLLLPARPVLSSFASPFENFTFQVTYADIGIQGVWLIMVGVIVGGVGSLFGLRKFLDV